MTVFKDFFNGDWHEDHEDLGDAITSENYTQFLFTIYKNRENYLQIRTLNV